MPTQQLLLTDKIATRFLQPNAYLGRNPIERSQQKDLISVLEDAKVMLARPDNDYSWSSWGIQKNALKEIDKLIDQISTNSKIDVFALEVIFTLAGPMQEVSLSSGWGDSFLELAKRYDKAIEPFK